MRAQRRKPKNLFSVFGFGISLLIDLISRGYIFRLTAISQL
jgi:hypothetical protein